MRINIACVASAVVLLICILPEYANAQSGEDDSDYSYVGPSDVTILFQPEPANYQPLGNLDADDEGKSFAIVCTISSTGHLSNCYAEANELNDQNFVRAGLASAKRWIVGPLLRDGSPSAGQTFRLVCRFDRVGRPGGAPAVASNGR